MTPDPELFAAWVAYRRRPRPRPMRSLFLLFGYELSEHLTEDWRREYLVVTGQPMDSGVAIIELVPR